MKISSNSWLERLCERPFPNSVPQGRLRVAWDAQDVSPGQELKGPTSPVRRLKITQDAGLGIF
jgi:hypothetical protein